MLRLHEPLTRVNWGGRSTSLAMAQIIETSVGRRVVSTISAPHIMKNLTSLDVKRDDGSGFTVVEELARMIAEPPRDASRRLVEVHDAIAAGEELVVNGEGDFILTERMTLVRTLAMMRAAVTMGKRVHLLNSLLSRAPVPPGHEGLVTTAVGETLSRCATICYRDPESLRLHQELYPSLDATWLPDALFAWAPFATADAFASQAFIPEMEGLPLSVQRLVATGEPYMVVSGSSRPGIAPDEFRKSIRVFASELRRHETTVVFAGSDTPDRKLANAVSDIVPVVDPQAPLSAVSRLLWNARCLVSGRYHPSILAALGGTPFVLMASNSHKTRSLHEVVPFGQPALEHSFFGGGQRQAVQLADLVLRQSETTEIRERIGDVSAENAALVSGGYVRLLGGVGRARATSR